MAREEDLEVGLGRAGLLKGDSSPLEGAFDACPLPDVVHGLVLRPPTAMTHFINYWLIAGGEEEWRGSESADKEP